MNYWKKKEVIRTVIRCKSLVIDLGQYYFRELLEVLGLVTARRYYRMHKDYLTILSTLLRANRRNDDLEAEILRLKAELAKERVKRDRLYQILEGTRR